MAMDWEHKNLIHELNQGKELAEALRKHINNCISSPQTREFLIEKLLSSYEKALSMLNWNGFPVFESPNPLIPSCTPTSDISTQDFKDPNQKNVSKKRKTQPRYTEQVKVSSGTGLEGPLDDGYSWRKYGQKDILGANFPRGYYRCSHRHSQGCLAVKQVQRSDEDPSVFEVTYRGRHTCVQPSHLAMPNNSKQQQEAEPVFVNSGETEDLGIFPSFSIVDKENHELVEVSPAFISPATSESNYFSAASCHMDNFGIGYNVQTPESELGEIISFPTSAADSRVDDFDFSIFDFDTNFPFDKLEYFN